MPEFAEGFEVTPGTTRLLLVCLIGVAFALRAWRLDLVPFQIDEGIASAVATQTAHGRTFPLAGIRTSFGFQNPPLFLYLLAPFFAISRDPILPALFFVVLGTAAVWLAWRAGMIVAGRSCAWAAALMMAFSPNAIEHCRRLWGHDLQVFLGMAALYAALYGWRRRSLAGMGISFGAAAMAQAMHLSGIIAWLPGLAVILGGNFVRWRQALMLGGGALFLIYLPWMIHEVLNGFHDIRVIFGLFFVEPMSGGSSLPVHPAMAWTLTLSDYWQNDLAGEPRPWMLSGLAGFFSGIQTVVSLILLAGGLTLLLVGYRRRWNVPGSNPPLMFSLFLPMGVCLGLFGILLERSVAPYHLPALPAMVLAAAWWVAAVWRRRALRPIVACLMVAWCLASAGLVVEVRRSLADGQGTGISLGEKKELIRVIGETVGGDSFFMAQDGRSPSAGLDVAFVYLNYWAGIHEQFDPNPLTARHVFVVVDHRSRLVPAVDSFLQRRTFGDFDHQTLHAIPPGDRAEWLELLRRFPAPSR